MSKPDSHVSRLTFAIISHPDAGKTTVTEQLLLHGGAIQLAGTVKAKKAARHATSDWMKMEQERGISVTSSVMQFTYADKIINLLDTPGHADFSEDTYRTLTAVDSAMMIIDAAKGVEDRTRKLMDICRMRDTPIMTFINKLDREGKEPIELLDEIERELAIKCAPVVWPLGMGSRLQGILHLDQNLLYPYAKGLAADAVDLGSTQAHKLLAGVHSETHEELELVTAACERFAVDEYRCGRLTPVFFGSALHNFGVREFLEYFTKYAPEPRAQQAVERTVMPDENKFSGFVFKIQANMDPAHRDRIAFLRVCSGYYRPGARLYHVRLQRPVTINNALTFLAGERGQVEEAWPGDIIGLHNHGTIQVGDTFTEGENLNFTGIPHFAPELFRRITLQEPLKSKALLKGLMQLGEEGATQVFRPLRSNDLIVGAVGSLQFDVVAWRLREEYGVECSYDKAAIVSARWISSDSLKKLEEFKQHLPEHLALDGADHLTYLAPTQVNLTLTMERWPDIRFHSTREH